MESDGPSIWNERWLFGFSSEASLQDETLNVSMTTFLPPAPHMAGALLFLNLDTDIAICN